MSMMRLRPVRSVDELLAVANARHGPGGHWHSRAHEGEPDHDHLLDAGDAVRFLGDHGVATPASDPPAAVLEDLRTLAAAVRELAAGSRAAPHWPTPALDQRLRAARYRLASDGTLVSVAADGWRRLVDDLAAAAVALGQEAEALRTCDNPLCRFVFVDRSRNRSRRWCDMSACGNRAKLRRYRRRSRSSSGAGGDQPGRMSGLSTTQATTTSARRPSRISSGRRSGR